MSALARYYLAAGCSVAGYDRTPSPITDSLQLQNCSIHFVDNVDYIPEDFKNCRINELLLIYTPAVSNKNSELKYFAHKGIQLFKRAQILGKIAKNFNTIAVAGTHGKTSVSTMIAHIFIVSDQSVNAVLGGISKNYDSNLILDKNAENAKYFVTEADEFDRSFLHLFPKTAVITSIDEDHLDIYSGIDDLKETFAKFVSQISKKGCLLIKNYVEIDKSDFPENTYTYNVDGNADFFAQNIITDSQGSKFDLKCPSTIIKGFKIQIPGKLNVENAVAAAAVAFLNHIPESVIIEALGSWTGVKRRFEYIINSPELVYIDDYAHHPEELKAFINSVTEIYPGKKITGVFQPHLYTRTRDFADDFAQSLSLLNELILLDIYPAREEAIEGVTSEIIFDKVNIKNKSVASKNNIVEILKNKDFDVLVTVGAGDISTEVEKIKNMLINRIIIH